METVTIGPGLHQNVPMAEYLALDALGSSSLEWIGVSPRHFQYMSTAERGDTAATARGTAVHMAVLEPSAFKAVYTLEPDVTLIGGASPRATKAYKDEVAAMRAGGRIVLKRDDLDAIEDMAAAVWAHPHAAALLHRAPQREVTGVWNVDGLLCRGRFDALGPGVLADLKTTNKLKDFSPWTITKRGYYRQLAMQRDGLKRLGHEIHHAFLIAVESSAPYDVGVFALDGPTLDVGWDECRRLMDRLAQCKRTGNWPGMYPDVQQAQLSDAVALQLPDLDSEE